MDQAHIDQRCEHAQELFFAWETITAWLCAIGRAGGMDVFYNRAKASRDATPLDMAEGLALGATDGTLLRRVFAERFIEDARRSYVALQMGQVGDLNPE